MKIVHRYSFSYSLLMSSIVCSAQAGTVPEASDTHRITVHVYNYVHAHRTLVAGAQAEANRLLSQAGVETVWLDCTKNGDLGSPDSACSGGIHSTDFVMNIVDRLQDLDPWAPRTTLGFSIVPTNGEFGSTSYVSFPRVRVLTASGKFPEAKLLGLAMAHELGHLLLGMRHHSWRGIMRAFWTAQQLENFDSSEFLFTNEQSKELRASVAAREKRDTWGRAAARSTCSQTGARRSSVSGEPMISRQVVG